MTARLATYCHLLWDSAFIDQRGNVYACCHSRPAILGNIGQDDMATIWTRSRTLAMFRDQSARGRLRCAPRCNVLSPEEKAGIDRPPVCPEHPRNLWLLWGELCNISCTMCGQDHRSRVALDRETLERNIAWTEVEEVELVGGEVLAMKGAKDFYLWLTRETRTKCNVITNGLLLTEEWAEHLVRGANWLQVSVNAATKATHELVNRGSKFERVLAGLGLLVQSKRRHGSGVEIVYKFTIVPQNLHEVADAIERAEELGCDRIAFGYDSPVPGFLAGHPDLARRLRGRLAELLASERRIEVEEQRLRYLGLRGDGTETLERAREVSRLPDPVSVLRRMLGVYRTTAPRV